MNSLFALIFFIATIFIFMKSHNYLYVLVTMELMSLSVLVMLLLHCGALMQMISFLIFLAMVTAEAALGLTMLVSLLRVNGNDNFSSSSSTMW